MLVTQGWLLGLEAVLQVLRKNGVRRFEHKDWGVIEFSTAPEFVPLIPPQQQQVAVPQQELPELGADALPPDPCACSHSIEIEHSPAGCLHGCAITLCNSTEESK